MRSHGGHTGSRSGREGRETPPEGAKSTSLAWGRESHICGGGAPTPHALAFSMSLGTILAPSSS
eukprot:2130667-Prymnesium_polylepis.1